MYIPENWGKCRESNTGDKLRITRETVTNLSAQLYNPTVKSDDWCQVIIHISGDVEYSTPFEKNKADVLDIFTTGNGENYCINWKKNKCYDRYVIYFVPKLLHSIYSYEADRKAAFSFLDRTQSSNFIKLPSDLKDELTVILNNVDLLLGSSSSEAAIGVFTAAVNIFNIIYKALSLHKTPAKEICSGSIASKALRYIDDNFTEISTIAQISENIHICPDYLSRKFKADVGVGIKEYILDKKLYYSHHLLRLGHNVTEASLGAGFQNISYFIRLYKKKFGVTPGKFEERSL